jgi:hypothetical protein
MVESVTTCSRMDSEQSVAAASEIVAAAAELGVRARVLGGIGVALRCPSARPPGELARGFSDIDLVTMRNGGQGLGDVLSDLGYLGETRFNAMHGHSRLLFDHPDGTHIDVFIGRFEMCHSLDLDLRLDLHEETVSLADLLLTKLQVAQLNEKDVTDAAALLLDHPLSADESGINLGYVAGLLSRDWGWWRTVTENLRALPAHLSDRLPRDSWEAVDAQVTVLMQAIEAAPRSLRWRARAKAGDRLPWREEPEESH